MKYQSPSAIPRLQEALDIAVQNGCLVSYTPTGQILITLPTSDTTHSHYGYPCQVPDCRARSEP
jgi:hypothetical protein